jgi:hypothetical protein
VQHFKAIVIDGCESKILPDIHIQSARKIGSFPNAFVCLFLQVARILSGPCRLWLPQNSESHSHPRTPTIEHHFTKVTPNEGVA